MDDERHSCLTRIPYEEEIQYALFSIILLKTLREDGLHVVFYQKNWDITKHQLIPAIQETFIDQSIPKEWGNTLLCLIPKADNAHKVHHFRPLGLCTTHYKTISKILMNRLKLHLPTLISPFQGAFLLRRHVSDFFLIA